MGYFEEFGEDGVTYKGDTTLADIADESSIADERGLLGDTLHSLYKGTTHAVDFLGAATEVPGLRDLGSAMMDAEFAKDDISQYYGNESRAKKIATMVLENVPQMVGQMALPVAGALTTGPVGAIAGGAASLGLVGTGTYETSLEEVQAEMPNLSPGKQHEYAMSQVMWETIPEIATNVLPFAGKFVGSASKNLVKGLVQTGRITPGQAIGAAVKTAGAKDIAKLVAGGAAVEGASEVVTAIGQQANAENIGMEKDPISLVDTFIVGAVLGGAVTTPSTIMEANNRKKVKENLQEGLQSEDIEVRQHTATIIEDQLFNIDPSISTAFRKEINQSIEAGPVDIDTVFQQPEEVVAEKQILERPSEILAEAGIPTDEVPVATGETPVVEGEIDMTRRTAADIRTEVQTRAMVREGDAKIVSDFMQTTGVTLPEQFDLSLETDQGRKNAVLKGMAEVVENSNQLKNNAELTLEERSKLRKENIKKQQLIEEEVGGDVPKVETWQTPERQRSSKEIAETFKEGTVEGSVSPTVDTKVVTPKKEVATTEDVVEPEEKTRKAEIEAAAMDLKPLPKEEVAETTGDHPVVQTYDGTTIHSGNKTKGKRYAVKGTDGEWRRFGSMKEAKKAIKEKKVDSALSFYEQKAKVAKPAEKVTEEKAGSLETFLTQYETTEEVRENLEAAGKRVPSPLENLAKDLDVDVETIGDALVKVEGPITKAKIKTQVTKLEKSLANKTDQAKMADEGIRTDTVSSEKIFAKEEKAAQETEAMDDVEMEETTDIDAPTRRKVGALSEARVTDETTQFQQKGKGSFEFKEATYFETEDGPKKLTGKKRKEAEEAGTPSVTVTETPSGAHRLTKALKGTTKIERDGKTHMVRTYHYDVHTKDGQHVGTYADKNEATQALYEAQGVEELAEEMAEETMGQRVARNQLSMAEGSVTQAIKNMKKAFSDHTDTVFKEALAILEDRVEKPHKHKDGLKLLESIANRSATFKDDWETKVAQFLLESVDHKKLKALQIFSGTRNYHQNGRIVLTPGGGVRPMLHEIVHGITVNELKTALGSDSGRKMRMEVKKMLETYREKLIKDDLVSREEMDRIIASRTSKGFREEGLNDIDVHGEARSNLMYAALNEKEFLSQAFSSMDVQSVMKRVKGQRKWKDLWKRFVDMVGKALGLKKGQYTMLEQVMTTVPILSQIDVTKRSKEVQGMEVPELDEEVRAILKQKEEGSKTKPIYEQLTNIKNFAEHIAKPIGDIVEEYSPKLRGSLMKFESRLIQKQKEYSKKAKPFMKWYKGLSKSEQTRYSMALMNSNLKDSQAVIKEIPAEVWNPLKEVLDDLRGRQENVGLGGIDKEFYFPRRVEDLPGLMGHLLKDSAYKGPIGYAFQQEAKRLDVPYLSEEQKRQVMTDMFQAGNFRQLPRPGASKTRTIPFVDRETFGFYSDPNDAIMGHIFEMNEKIGQREFIGGSERKKKIQEMTRRSNKIEKMEEGPERDAALAEYVRDAERLEDIEAELQDNLAQMVYETMGDKPGEDQQAVIDAISARLRQQGAHGIVDAIRNVSYIATMGNFLSAITQLGDIPILFYAHRDGSFKDNLDAVKESFQNVFKIAKRELTGKDQDTDAFVDMADFTNQLKEFSTGKVTAEWVEKAFKYSGLKFTDLVGKEAFMRAAYKKYRKPENKDAFTEKYTPFFGEETGRVWKEMQSDEKTADVLTVLIAELAEFQPISLSQQSKGYLGSGNMRVFYMLKTFTLRATSAALREGAKEIKQGNVAKGVAKVASILMIYSLAGAGADELKDLIRGKESTITDNTTDNLLQMLFLSKYTLDKGMQSDSVIKTITSNLLPPTRLADSLIADTYAMMSEDKEFKAKTLSSVPLIGTIAYGRSPAGQSAQEKKAILEQVKENKKKKKGAYAGGLNRKIREYNKGVSRDKRISNDSVMRTYNR